MKNFLKIYLWQFLSLITGFASMFVVTPYLASHPNYFGIYTFVVSLGLFLSYTDFGFLSAATKFAAEAYIKKDRETESQMFGFVTFVMAIFFAFFGIAVFIFKSNPSLVLKNISVQESRLASQLFMAFLVALPVTLANRIIALVYNIRLHDYKYQRISSLMNMVKISSVIFFFQNGTYNIVGFYWFAQLLTLITVVIGVVLAVKNYDYNFGKYIGHIRFNKPVYDKTKSLAFSSLFLTISWVIYYELDSLVIGRFVGLKEVAVFNICLSLMTLARSLYGIIYGPFSAKFNHYIGANRLDEFDKSYHAVLVLGLPLALLPTGILVMSMNGFIISWVGEAYVGAIPVATLMFASYFFNFVSYPAGIAMMAKQKIKEIYWISFTLPLIYWFGVYWLFPIIGLQAFGLFKLLAFALSGFFYFLFSARYMRVNWTSYFKENGIATIGSLIFIAIVTVAVKGYLPEHKSTLSLICYGFYFLSLLVSSGLFYYGLSPAFRKQLSNIKNRI